MAIVRKIAAVSYLNTIPFIYGIEHSGVALNSELTLCTPAQCAELFREGRVDLALLPSAVVPTLVDAQIVSGFCIGASSAVRSVVIFSDEPKSKIKRIFVDSHSRTSTQLAGYIVKEVWGKDVEWIELDDISRLKSAQYGDAFMLIGDKVFEHEGEFDHTFDLAQEWIKATSLPFTFAVWVARKGCEVDFLESFEEALTFGVEHIYEALLEYRGGESVIESYEYLTENIDFLLDFEKREALKRFWDIGTTVTPIPSPG